MFLDLAGDGLDDQAEHAEERGEADGDRDGRGQGPADGDGAGGAVVTEDEKGQVGREQGEAARVDGGEDAGGEREGEGQVGHRGSVVSPATFSASPSPPGRTPS
jgi:hypothetical protein